MDLIYDQSPGCTLREIETLKRQVTRLTQLRRDRDGYIQELLSEERRHEGDMARRTTRGQWEIVERFAAQQQDLEERSRKHAAALAQQAWQHELELGEVRKALRKESAEKLSQAARQHCRDMESLKIGLSEIHEQIIGLKMSESSCAKERHSSSSDVSAFGSTPPRWHRSASQALEPEPEEGNTSFELEASTLETEQGEEDPFAQLSLSEQAASRATEAAGLALVACRQVLGQTLTHRPLSAVGEQVSKSHSLGRAVADLQIQATLTRSLLSWRVSCLEAAASRQHEAVMRNVRAEIASRASILIAKPEARLENYCLAAWLHLWMKETACSQAAKSGDALKAAKSELAVLEAELSRTREKLEKKLEDFDRFFRRSYDDRWQQAAFRVWSTASLSSSCAKLKADIWELRLGCTQQLKVFRQQRCERERIRLDLEQASRQHLFLRLWREASSASRAEKRHSAEALAFSRLRKQDACRALKVADSQFQHVTLWAWATVVATVRHDAACEHNVQVQTDQVAEAALERSQLLEEFENQSLAMNMQLQVIVGRVVQAYMHRWLATALLNWAAAVNERKREAVHRHRVLELEAASSAELFRFRIEAKRTAMELRKQRRAHGVAAVHASLDRRLQSVVHAWSVIARDSQREGIYQRQLDIAAAESAAGCAVLRMEGRRTQLDLRNQRRASGMRALEASRRQVRHVVVRAWRGVIAAGHQEDVHVRQLGMSMAQAAAASAVVRNNASKLENIKAYVTVTMSTAHMEYLVEVSFSSWAKNTESARRAQEGARHAADLRLLARRWGEATAKLQENFSATQQCTQVFTAWKVAVLLRDREAHQVTKS